MLFTSRPGKRFILRFSFNMVTTKFLQHVLKIASLDTGHELLCFDDYMDPDVKIATIDGCSGQRKDSEMFFAISSILTPPKIYKVEFQGDDRIEPTLIHKMKLNGYDSSKFILKQVIYTSKDGTPVPMFVVHKNVRSSMTDLLLIISSNFKDTGITPRPCILYGYGGFNASMTSTFGISRIPFINNFDGVYAVANIRGGG